MTTAAMAKTLEEQISAAIKQYVAQAVEEAVEQAKRDLTAKIPEITASVGIQVASYLEAHNNEAVLQIRLTPNWR